jgi:predicted small metal-binding protein
MKTMTCNQLGGACDTEIQAETFDEIAQLCLQHGMKMFQSGDAAHLKAMEQIQAKMNDPKAMQEWMDEKREEFNALPETN